MLLKNSVDPDQLASLEASWSGSTLFSNYMYGIKVMKNLSTWCSLRSTRVIRKWLKSKTLVRLRCLQMVISINRQFGHHDGHFENRFWLPFLNSLLDCTETLCAPSEHWSDSVHLFIKYDVSISNLANTFSASNCSEIWCGLWGRFRSIKSCSFNIQYCFQCNSTDIQFSYLWNCMFV